MMARKIVLILLAPLIVEIAIGCCHCDDAPSVASLYTYKSIQLENLDNRGAEPVVSESGPYLKEAYGLRVHLYRDLIAHSSGAPVSFFPSAYAFSCGCENNSSISARDSITYVHIITLRDFDASHQAGAEISDLFRVQTESYGTQELTRVGEYATGPYLRYASADRFLRDMTFDILLFAQPAAGGLYKFKIQFTLSDGRVLEQETPEIQLM